MEEETPVAFAFAVEPADRTGRIVVNVSAARMYVYASRVFARATISAILPAGALQLL